MLIIAIIPILIMIAGLLAYVLSANSKIVEVGRIMFFCGLLVTCFVFAREVVKI